ncbi:MAG TPA: hypothetical protein P5077_08565 [bacterium]|nr:hypothetical protein [bacterium]
MVRETLVSARVPGYIREQMKNESEMHGMSESAYLKTLLELHFADEENRFITYEGHYLKAVLERNTYNIYAIMEHLKRTKDPLWDGKAYHEAAKGKALKSEKDCHKEATLERKERSGLAPVSAPSDK